MSQAIVRRALEKHLDTLTGLATAFENGNYVPVTDTPYQRVNLLPAAPDNSIQGTVTYFERGVFQITLCYPLGNGAGAAEARAGLTRGHFWRGTVMVESGIRVLVTTTPRIAPGFQDDDRWCIPVSVTYQAQVST